MPEEEKVSTEIEEDEQIDSSSKNVSNKSEETHSNENSLEEKEETVEPSSLVEELDE